jgi:hypothetical protein
MKKNILVKLAGAVCAVALGVGFAMPAQAASVYANLYYSFSADIPQGHYSKGHDANGFKDEAYGPYVGPGARSYSNVNYNVYKYGIYYGYYA